MARHNARGMNDANNWFVFVATMAILSALTADRNSNINALLQYRIIQSFRLAGVRYHALVVGYQKDRCCCMEEWGMHLSYNCISVFRCPFWMPKS